MRFSVDPLPGADAFQQWRDAMKAVARLPLGIPPEFRKNVSKIMISGLYMSIMSTFLVYLHVSVQANHFNGV
jgi:hypothetical protein